MNIRPVRLPPRVVMNAATPEWFRPVAPRYRPQNGFLCDRPQERLPDAPDRGYPRAPKVKR